MADFTLPWYVRLWKEITPSASRRSLYSVGRWFGEYAPIADTTDRFEDGDAVDIPYPFLRIDLVTGAQTRPPSFIPNSIVRGGIVRGGDNPSFEPAIDYLPGVRQLRNSEGRLVGLIDETARDRRGEGFSWAHITALQSQDADWGEDQPLWSSAPTLDLLIEGLRIAQPVRNDMGDTQLTAAAYSTNPALIRAWLLITRKGVSMANIDVDSLAEAARICNQSYTTFLSPEALRTPLAIADFDYGDWRLDTDGEFTIDLPGRTAATRISAVAQDPTNLRSYCLISSNDNKIWYINQLGDAEVLDTFPPLPTGVTEMHMRTAAAITQDGTLIVFCTGGTRTADDAAYDGFNYPAMDRTTPRYLYVRKLRSHATGVPRPNISGVTLDSVGDHAWVSLMGGNGRSQLVSPLSFALRSEIDWLDGDFVDNSNENDLVALGWISTYATGPVTNMGAMQLAAGGDAANWRTQVAILPTTRNFSFNVNTLGQPPRVLDDGRFQWWLRNDGSTEAFVSYRASSTDSVRPISVLDIPAQDETQPFLHAGLLRSVQSDRMFLVRRDGQTIDNLRRVSNADAITHERVRIATESPPRPRLFGLAQRESRLFVDISPLRIEETDTVTYRWEAARSLDPLTPRTLGTYTAEELARPYLDILGQAHYRAVVTITDADGTAVEHPTWWTEYVINQTEAFEMFGTPIPRPTPVGIEVDPRPTTEIAPDDFQNRLLIVAHNRPYGEGGYRQLGYGLPRAWDDIQEDALGAGQARLFEGSVYWCQEDLPAGYWDSPPESPEAPLWTRIGGDRHLLIRGGLPPDFVIKQSIVSRRYEAHGEIYTDSDLPSVERSLDDAMLGHVVEADGKYYIHAGRGELWTAEDTTPKAPIASISDRDLVEDGITVVEAGLPQQDVTNFLTCKMEQDQTNNWHAATVTLSDPYKIAAQNRENTGELDLRYVTNPVQARLIGNALLMEEREPLRLDLKVTPKLPPSDLEYSLVSLHPGDVVRCNFSLLGSESRDMIVERLSVDPTSFVVTLTLAVQTKDHTDLFFGLPPLPVAPDERDTETIHPLGDLTLQAGSIDGISANLTPTEAGRSLVCAAGMSMDRRFTFVGMNAARSDTQLRPPTPAQPAVPGTPAVPERPAETAFEYTLTDDDVGSTMQVRIRWTRDDGSTPMINGWRSIVIGAAGGTNNRTGSFNGVTQSGNFVSGETINVTVDRASRTEWADAELQAIVIRRDPGQSIGAAPEIHYATLRPMQAAQPEVPGTPAVPADDGFGVPARVLVFDNDTGKVGAISTQYWDGYATNGAGIVGYQGDPRLTTHGGSRDHLPLRGDNNALTLPSASGIPGFLFISGAVTVDRLYEFRDMEDYEQARGYLYDPLLAFKTDGSNTQVLSESTGDQRGLMCVVAWYTNDDGTERLVYGIEALSTDGQAPRGSLPDDPRENSISPWNGTVRFEGDAPVRTDYTAVLDDTLYTYWLRTNGVVEVRGSLFSWARNTDLERHADLDVPEGLIVPGDSIAVPYADGDAIRITAFKADGSGYYSLTNAENALGGTDWRVVTRRV